MVLCGHAAPKPLTFGCLQGIYDPSRWPNHQSFPSYSLELSLQYQCQLYTLCHHHNSQLLSNSAHPQSSHGNYDWEMINYVFPLSSYHIQPSYQLQPPVPGCYAPSTVPRYQQSFTYTLHIIITSFGCNNKKNRYNKSLKPPDDSCICNA